MTRPTPGRRLPRLPGVVAAMAAAVLVAACSQESERTSATPPAPPSSSTAPTDPPAAAPDDALPSPLSVTIPSLDIDDEVIELGIDDEGALEVPEDHDRIGWFSGGSRPGSPGPTVLAGHVDSRTGPAVFARLETLREGDRVTMSGGGSSVTYVVTDTRSVEQDAFPTEDVFGATVDDQLRLITCTGEFDADRGGYQSNRVVTAVAE